MQMDLGTVIQLFTLRRRVGDHRIAFTIDFEKSEVVVLRLGRRGKFYQEEPQT